MKAKKDAALELIDKAVAAIQVVQVHLLETHDDNLVVLALNSAISEIEGVGAIIGFDFKGFDNVPAPIRNRIAERATATISETQISEFFEWLESTGEWTCDSIIFDTFWQRFKKSHA
jgi:hypothetical protein